MGGYSLLEPIHNFNIGNFDELYQAKDKAQEHFESLLMPYLEQVQDKNHLDIHYHANNWIKNDAEIQLAKERLIRETNLEWTNDYVIQAIQMFVKNLVSEGDIYKTHVDFRKYFYNFTKYRINNASTSKKGKGTNDEEVQSGGRKSVVVSDAIAALPELRGMGNVASLRQAMPKDCTSEQWRLAA
jgi:hypothetical protein